MHKLGDKVLLIYRWRGKDKLAGTIVSVDTNQLPHYYTVKWTNGDEGTLYTNHDLLYTQDPNDIMKDLV